MPADKAAAAAVTKPATTRAYVTLLVADEDSFKGVVRLAKGLRSAGQVYPLVVAVLPDVPESLRRVLMDELGCVVREVQPVDPPHYNKIRVWEFVEYDEMMYLDAGFQGSLESIHEQFEPNHGPPPAACLEHDMFVYKPSIATARVLVNAVCDMVILRTTIADQQAAANNRLLVHALAVKRMRQERTAVAADQQQQQQQAARPSSQQFSNGLATPRQVMLFYLLVAAVAVQVVTFYLYNLRLCCDGWITGV